MKGTRRTSTSSCRSGGTAGHLPLDFLAGGVEADVVRRCVQKLRVVTEQPEPVVASLAEQPSDSASGVIMIKMLGCCIPTDGASVLLRSSKLAQLPLGQLVPPVEVSIPAGSPLAGLAPARQSRRCATALIEVFVRDRLLA